MKRFWTHTTYEPDGAGFALKLDGRPLRLSGGPALHVRQRALAEAIATEWQSAPVAFSQDDLPLTRLAGTAQERVAADQRAFVATLAAYAETDLLCYRAESPEALVIRQHHAWQPWLDWAASTYGAGLVWRIGIMPIAQDDRAVAALRTALDRLDSFTLAGLGVLVPALGSLVLGLAVAAGRLEAAQAHRISILDELFVEEQWGEDADAVQRRAYVARDIGEAARFMVLATA